MRFYRSVSGSLEKSLTYIIALANCFVLSGCFNGSVSPIQSTIVITSSQTPSTYRNAVTFSATVSSAQGGTVTFFDGGDRIGSGAIQRGVASLTINSLTVGTHSITASWPGEGSVEPASSAAITQMVTIAIPTVTWPEPSPLIYGNPLSSSQLDASAGVPGTFVYSPGLGTIPTIGTNTLSVAFTPTDTLDYSPVTASVQLSVVPPSFALSTPSTTILAGSSISFAATMNDGPNEPVAWAVNGIFGGNPTIGTITPDGVYTAPNVPNATETISALLQADPAVQESVQVTVVGPQTTPGGIGFAFNLPTLAATSAGVYDSSGNLVRTLWSNNPYLAGPQAESWDGKDDYGNTPPAGQYQIRVLYNNVQYTWGVIGNTSASWTSPNSWDNQDFLPVDMAVIGDTAYVANQYEEGRPNASSFPLAHPQEPSGLFYSSPCSEYHWVTTDGNLLYFANPGNGWEGSVAFVMALDPKTSDFYTFPQGQTYSDIPYSSAACGGGQWPTSVVDYQAPTSESQTGGGRTNIPSGIAVQTHGNLLAVSHGAYDGLPSMDIIRLFDKVSGAFLGVINVPNPQRLAFAPDGDLWVVSGNSVVRISSVGAANSIAVTLPGLSSPIAVSVDPTTDDVLVTDGVLSQQVKRFSQSGQLISTYGDLGGYTDCNPAVTTSRLFLDEKAGVGYVGAATGYASAFVNVLPDGTFWFGDPGNSRLLHISSSGTYIEQIAFMRFLYQVKVDHGNPTRVFANQLEFAVDNSKQIVPGDPDPSLGGNGSWKLVRNWFACMPTNYATAFDQVQTFSNGRTYALIGNSNKGWYDELAELPESGPPRFSAQILGFTGPGGSRVQPYFTHTGNLAYWELYGPPGGGWTSQIAYQEDFQGYDTNAWPVLGSPYPIASAPNTVTANPVDPEGFFGWGMMMYPEPTSNGMVMTYNTIASTTEPNHHIGGVPLNGTYWSWKASPGGLITSPDGHGTFPDIQSFGGHNGIAVLVEGSNVFEGYDGQYGSFSSQWMHWNQDGLLIGQFGHPAHGNAPDGTLWPEAAGNIATMGTASANGNIYLYNSDESYHPGIHQWTISGLDTIHELAGSSSIGGTVILQ